MVGYGPSQGYVEEREIGLQRHGQDPGLRREWIKIVHSGRSKLVDRRWDKRCLNDTFGIPGENGNGIRVEKFCKERLCVGNTYYKHRSLHKYTREARG